jgi:ABC-type transport system involved in cytochrome bd biosynthesis fused ATPase/permease subunit
MTGLVASIGLRAIAGSALSKAGSAVGGFFKWLAGLDAIHVLLLVAALFGAWQTFGRWSQHRHTAKVEAQLASATNALTAARAELAASQANEAALEKAIADQNAAIADLGNKSAAQQAAAAKALLNAQGRAAAAQASADRLRASARAGGASGGACEPSKALKDQWQ